MRFPLPIFPRRPTFPSHSPQKSAKSAVSLDSLWVGRKVSFQTTGLIHSNQPTNSKRPKRIHGPVDIRSMRPPDPQNGCSGVIRQAPQGFRPATMPATTHPLGEKASIVGPTDWQNPIRGHANHFLQPPTLPATIRHHRCQALHLGTLRTPRRAGPGPHHPRPASRRPKSWLAPADIPEPLIVVSPRQNRQTKIPAKVGKWNCRDVTRDGLLQNPPVAYPAVDAPEHAPPTDQIPHPQQSRRNCEKRLARDLSARGSAQGTSRAERKRQTATMQPARDGRQGMPVGRKKGNWFARVAAAKNDPSHAVACQPANHGTIQEGNQLSAPRGKGKLKIHGARAEEKTEVRITPTSRARAAQGSPTAIPATPPAERGRPDWRKPWQTGTVAQIQQFHKGERAKRGPLHRSWVRKQTAAKQS